MNRLSLKLSSGTVFLGGIMGIESFSDIFESDYFKQFLAEYIIQVVQAVSTAVVHQVVTNIIYGA